MASITIKTPTRTISRNASQKDRALFLEEIENNVSKVCLKGLSSSLEKIYEEQISVISTFFQRVIARTPVDENYDRPYVTKTGEVKITTHTPDEEVCREHWYIEESHSAGKLYSKNLFNNGMGFDVVNNNEEIQMIKSHLKQMYPLKTFLSQGVEPSFTVGNDCKHFERLEYGYSNWESDTEPVIGMPIGREHGVKNKHSVQAPVGMLRITQMELESIKRKPSLKKITSRYKGGAYVGVTPSEKKLKEFYRMMKRGHRMRYADIKRFLEVY